MGRTGHDPGFQSWIDTASDAAPEEDTAADPAEDSGAADDYVESAPCTEPDMTPLGAPEGCRTVTYVRDDGADCVIEAKSTASHDGRGRLLSSEESDVREAVPDTIVRWAYDAARAQPSRQEVDRHRDGAVDETRAWTYDVAGRRVREDWDSDADGTTDSKQHWTYAADGQITADELDIDNDGTIEFGGWTTYDASGQAVQHLRFERGRHILWTTAYDAAGNVIRVEGDLGADGTLSYRYEYAYDAAGRLLAATYDGDLDSVADFADYWTYDDAGMLVEFLETSEEHGSNARAHTYDDTGRLNRIDYDDRADGTVDRSDVWTYDAEGRVVRFDYVYEGYFGEVDAWETWIYDDADRVISYTYESGYDVDVVTRERYEFVYRDDGLVQTMTHDEWLDGADAIVDYEWDAEGNPLWQRERGDWGDLLMWSYIDDC